MRLLSDRMRHSSTRDTTRDIEAGADNIGESSIGSATRIPTAP
jgi:hypothetical protein